MQLACVILRNLALKAKLTRVGVRHYNLQLPFATHDIAIRFVRSGSFDRIALISLEPLKELEHYCNPLSIIIGRLASLSSQLRPQDSTKAQY